MDNDIFFLDPLPLFKPTLLYGLSPLGIGTGDIESLQSYILSVSYAHRISPHSLIHLALQPIIPQFTNSKLQHRWNLANSASLVGSTANAVLWSRILDYATGQNNLLLTTLAPLNHLVADIGLVSKSERICLECCRQDIKSIGRSYGRLLWKIGLVECCPIHHVKLLEIACPLAGREASSSFRRLSLIGVCDECGRLGYTCTTSPADVATPTSIQRANQCRTLIKAFSSLQHVDATHLKRVVRSFAQDYGGCERLAKNACLSKSLLSRWFNVPSARLSLEAFINLSYVIGIDVVDFLHGRLENALRLDHLPVHRVKRPVRRVNRATIADRMLSGLEAGETLGKIAEEVGVDRVTLRNCDPQTYQKIAERSKYNREIKIKADNNKNIALASKILFQLVRDQRPLTLRNAIMLTGSGWHSNNKEAIAFLLLRNELSHKKVAISKNSIARVSESFKKGVHDAAIDLRKKISELEPIYFSNLDQSHSS